MCDVYQILKKSRPATDDERLLLELVTCDPVAIAPTLKNLLRCGKKYRTQYKCLCMVSGVWSN